jgi:hypothetical protein
LDKKEIADLLEVLCERPFADDPDGRPLPVQAVASRAARALSNADEEPSGSIVAQSELATILSGTATAAQGEGFQDAAATSGAIRLDAQSALAFVDGIEQAPLTAPAHLVEQVLASAGGASLAAKPSIWSRLAGVTFAKGRGQLVAACAVMLMAGGLVGSLLWRPTDLAPSHPAAPAATNPNDVLPIGVSGPNPGAAPALSPLSVPAPPPVAPTLVAPVPVPAAAEALADPCAPRSFATSEASSIAEPKATKSAPNRPSRIANVSEPDPGCTGNGGPIEAARNPQADQEPVRAARPAAKIGRFDRDPTAAATSAPASAAHPRPAKPPHMNQPPR